MPLGIRRLLRPSGLALPGLKVLFHHPPATLLDLVVKDHLAALREKKRDQSIWDGARPARPDMDTAWDATHRRKQLRMRMARSQGKSHRSPTSITEPPARCFAWFPDNN